MGSLGGYPATHGEARLRQDGALQGLRDSNLFLPDHPSVPQHLVGLSLCLLPSPCSAWPPSQHGGTDSTGGMHLQLHFVLLVLLGAQPQEIWDVESRRMPMSQPCFWSPVQILGWLLALSHGDRV